MTRPGGKPPLGSCCWFGPGVMHAVSITVWPATLPLKVEATFGSITVDLFPGFLKQEIRIVYGAQNENSSVQAATIAFELDNPDSHYTPDHPMSQYWPHVQLGVPIQVSVFWAGAWHIRFTGQVSEWKPYWPYGDLSDETKGRKGEARVTVVASGIFRQLAQGKSPVRSPLYRTMLGGLENDIPAIAYWPMEDGANATQFASAIPGAAPLTVVAPATLSTNSDIPGSAPLPAFGVGAGASGPIPSHTDTGVWYAQAVGLTSDFSSYPGFTVVRVEVVGADHVAAVAAGPVSSGGFQLGYSVLSPDEYPITIGSSPLSIDPTGVPLSIVVGMKDNASGTDDYLYVRAMTGDGTVVGSIDVNLGPGEYGRGIVARPNGKAQLHDNGVVGHFAYYTDPAFTLGVHDVQNAMAINGHAGEQAHERVDRLCREHEIPVTIIGTESAVMGPQPIDILYNLLSACAQVDMGILHEDLEALGLVYRCNRSLYNQDPALTLDARANELANPFRPTLDDLNVRNDVTVQRINGSEYRSIVESGPKSIQASPNGVGTYDERLILNLNTDSQTVDNAKWRTFRGTWPGMRYPRVSPAINAVADVATSWLGAGIGDLVQVTNLPPQHPAATVELLIRGYTETLTPTSWVPVINTAPAGPYTVAEVDSNTRVTAEGSTLGASLSSTAMSFTLASTVANGVWTTDPADFPLDVNAGGERVRLSAISGSSSPQTATVATGGRSINGVTKAHASGTAVDEWEPAVVAL